MKLNKGLFIYYVIHFRGLENRPLLPIITHNFLPLPPPLSDLDYVIYEQWGIAFIRQKNLISIKTFI